MERETLEKVNISEFLLDEPNGSSRDLTELFAIVRRQWKVVVLFGLLTSFFGVIYVFTATPKYTASTTILMDANNQDLANQVLSQRVGGVIDDETKVLSQVEIMKSEKVAGAVVTKLNLLNDPEFTSARSSAVVNAISAIKSMVDYKAWFSSSALTDAGVDELEVNRQESVATLIKNMAASRVGRTALLEVEYTSPYPALSARIANAIVESYLEDQLVSKYDSSRRASDWLEARISELREKSIATDTAVQKFKADKGLIEYGGKLISDQQLTGLNDQYLLAQSDTAVAKAKLDGLEKVIQTGQLNATVAESLNSQVINTLQGQYLEASRREAEISSRLGSEHIQASRLRSQMSEYRRLMFEELSRVAETYRATYEVARSRQAGLEERLKEAQRISTLANDDQVQLRELERESSTYRGLLESFLQRYQQASQQQSFPVTEARVISRADVPLRPSAPKKLLIVAFSLVVGCGIGALFGAYRELGERFFRTGEQVQQELSLEFLGQVPLETGKIATDNVPKSPPPGSRWTTSISGINSFVVDYPLSSFAETMRSAKIAVDIRAANRKGKIVGVVSVVPREGKSTVAINFAKHLAHQGSKTLLIDGDLRNPGATRAIGHVSEKGLFEVLTDNEPLENVLLTDPVSKLSFLPAVLRRRLPFSAELLTSPVMERMLAAAANHFDYVVIDLPPMGPVVDARAISSKIDCFLMVIEWGETARRLVRTAVQNNPAIMTRCAGVILNKVDMAKVDLYQNQDQAYYQNSKYGAYYLQQS